MSDIHLNRAGQNLGIFSQEEVQTGLNSGRFLGTDVAWRSGMENWKPLAQWSDLTIPAFVPPPPLTGPLGAGPITTLEGQELPSWEQKDRVGFFRAVGLTIKEVLVEPAATFSRMKETGGLMPPFLFLLLMVGLSAVASLILQLGMQGAMGALGTTGASQNSELARMMAFQGVGSLGLFLAVLIVLPIAVFVSSFIYAGLWHLALMILGGANKPFEATYRVYCYATGAAALLGLVPCCGGLVALVWGIVSGAIGLSKVHQIGTGKAVLTILLPFIFCCSIVGVGLFAGYQALVNNPEFMDAIKGLSR